MKTVVFDNAGTILKRVTALKNMNNKNILFETNTIGITNQKRSRSIIVLQTPTKLLLEKTGKLSEYLRDNPDKFEISYTHENITKKEVITSIKNDTASINDIYITANNLISKYNLEICSGTALIIDTDSNKIDYVYTSGGMFFDKTRWVIKELQKRNIPIYIASGDNKDSLLKIADILDIPFANVYDTTNAIGKKEIVNSLQEKGNYVYMVGNNSNDQYAIKTADVGVLNLEQGEKLSDDLLNIADYKISNIGQLLDIL